MASNRATPPRCELPELMTRLVNRLVQMRTRVMNRLHVVAPNEGLL